MVPILDATGAVEVEDVVLIIEKLPNLNVGVELMDAALNGSDPIALLALGARLFNGDCVATPKGLAPGVDVNDLVAIQPYFHYANEINYLKRRSDGLLQRCHEANAPKQRSSSTHIVSRVVSRVRRARASRVACRGRLPSARGDLTGLLPGSKPCALAPFVGVNVDFGRVGDSALFSQNRGVSKVKKSHKLLRSLYIFCPILSKKCILCPKKLPCLIVQISF
jgi:hypothetical protein